MSGQPEHTTRPGENVDASVAGVHVPVPDGWEERLRAISPVVDDVSHARFYWYRAAARWVLYDCLPAHLLKPDVAYGPILGSELLARLQGAPPRLRSAQDQSHSVSDVQHEFYRCYRVWAVPFWVLQGEGGGHPVRFGPWEQNVLTAAQLPTVPPALGALAPCPFDHRTVRQLERRNRLFQFEGSLRQLRASGGKEAADRMISDHAKEMRLAECAYIEQMLTPLLEQSHAATRNHSERETDLYQVVRPDSAKKAADAYDQYKETGDYALERVPAGI